MKKVFRAILDYFRSVVVEIKKISFPARKQVITDSTVVLSAIILSILLIGLFDGAISKLIKNLVIKG